MSEAGNERRKPAGIGRWIFPGFALIAAVFLFLEHRAHVVEFLPYGLLLACVLMHFMHGHGGHGGHGSHRGDGAALGEAERERRDP